MPTDTSTTSLPEISGSARLPVRVAVAQIAYHAAIRGALVDPLGEADREGKLPRSTLPPGAPAPDIVRASHRTLSDRIEAAYLAQLVRKLRAIVEACRAWNVQILVFPEYSVPAAALAPVAEAAGDMLVVAGSCFVDRAVRNHDVYDRLSAPSRPELRQNVAHVLFRSKIHALVAKLRATDKEQRFEMAEATDWSPVPIPQELGGALGVLICLDFLDHTSAPSGGPVLPKLSQCRALAVPALTSESSLPFFEGHQIEESGPRRRPVLFANHAPGGGSTIFAGERTLDEVQAFPLHAGVLEKGEEGVLVADLDLAVVGPGKGGRYGEAVPCQPFAAASLVYTGIDRARATWLSGLQKILPVIHHAAEEEALLERVTAWLAENPPPSEGATRMQTRRWDRMLQGLEDETSLEALRRLTREIVLSPEILPLGDIEAALASGAAKAIRSWTESGDESTAAFATVSARLAERARAGEPKRRAWADNTRKTWADISDAVRGFVEPPSRSTVTRLEPVLTLLDRATSAVEGHLKDAIEQGDALAKEGRLEEARAAFEKARAQAERQGEANDFNGDKWRLWAARAAIGAATCAANLQDLDGARTLLSGIAMEVLDTARRLRVANLWAGLGEVERARALVPAEAQLSPEEAKAARNVRMRIDLAEGRIPDDEDLAGSPDVALAAIPRLLNRPNPDAARAARLARRVLQPAKESAWILANAWHALLAAILTTANLAADNVLAIPLEQRAEILHEIEAGVPLILAQPLPEPVRQELLAVWRMLLHLTDDADGLAAFPPSGGESESSASEEITAQAADIQGAFRLAREGHVEAALQKLPPIPDSAHRRLLRLDVLRAAGQNDRVLSEALALASEMPGLPRVELVAAAALAGKGRHAEALEHALQARKALPARGMRLCVAQCLLALHRDQEAWEELIGDEPCGGPHVLRALAIAADQVFPHRALELWQRYLAERPRDGAARLHVAQLLFLQNRPADAAAAAWTAFERHADTLSVIELHRLGSLQGAPLPAEEQKRRARAIAATLQRRFPADPQAEQARLSLLAGTGALEREGAERIDFALLQEAGAARALTTSELMDWIRAQSQKTALVQMLGKRGSLPFELFCGAVTPPVAVPLVIVRLFHRERVEVPFSPPVTLPDLLAGFRLADAELLVSAVELYLLGALELLPMLREQQAGRGRVHLFRSAWMQVVEEHGLLRAQAEAQNRAALDHTVAALAWLPRLIAAQGEQGLSDIELAVRRDALILSMPTDPELRAAGTIMTDIPEHQRLSPRTVLGWLVDLGHLSEDDVAEILPYFALDRETPRPDPLPRLLLVDTFFLEKLHEHKVLTHFRDLFPTAHIGENAWRHLLERQNAATEDQRAAQLAEHVHGWIVEGMNNGHVQILADRRASDLPALKEPENEPLRELLIEPLSWAVRYADTLADHPSWYRVTADFFGSTAPLSPEMAPFLAWKDDSEPHALLRRLRTGTERHLSLPVLLRALLASPSDEAKRYQALFRLGELGFPDALGAEEIRALSHKYASLSGATPARTLDRLEWMAKEPGHLGGEMARLRLAGAYAATIFRAFCGRVAQGQKLSGTESTHQNAALRAEGAAANDAPMGDAIRPQERPLPAAEAEVLSRSLLGRAETIMQATRTDFLDVVFRFLAAETASAPALAWERDDAQREYRRKLGGPLASLWDFLQAWTGRSGPRRAACERGVGQVWLLVDGKDEVGIQIAGAALDHAVFGHHAPGEVRFTGQASEAETILSALWSWRPTSMRGLDLAGPGLPEKITLFDEQLLAFGARPETPLGWDVTGRFVMFAFPIPTTEAAIRVIAAAEAILLRLQHEDQITDVATALRRTQGVHDGHAYHLLASLARLPRRKWVRRAVARRAASALWRAVRDDPTYLVRWPRSRGTTAGSARPMLRELRAVLSEPLSVGSADTAIGALIYQRVMEDGGIWRSRDDGLELATMALEVPGGLLFGMVPTMLAEDYEKHIADALNIAEHSDEHPIARVGRSILLLRAGAAQKPLIKLPSGESIDLREKVPSLLHAVLDRATRTPAPGTIAEAEPALLRICAQVVLDLAGPSPISIRDGLWLTYRLFQWLWLQLEAISPDARAAAIRDLSALAPQPGTALDRLDPRGFGREHFDHRLATVLFALAAMQEPLLLSGKAAVSGRDITYRLAWHPAMIDTLVELSSRLDPSPGLRSTLDWGVPDNLSDLALVALLRTEPKAFERLPEVARLARLKRVPEQPEAMDEADRALFLPLVTQAAVVAGALSESERETLLARLRAMPAGAIAHLWRMQVLPSFFSLGVASVSETEATLAVQEALDHPLSPMALSLLLIGMAARDLPRMGAVMDAVLSEAEQRGKDPVRLAAGVGRVALFVEGAARKELVDRLQHLARRPPYEGDERMRELLAALASQ